MTYRQLTDFLHEQTSTVIYNSSIATEKIRQRKRERERDKVRISEKEK